MGKTRSMHYTDEKFVQNVVQKTVKGRDHLEDLGIGSRII